MARGKRPMLMKQPKAPYAPVEGADGPNPLQGVGVARPTVNRPLGPPGAPTGALSPMAAQPTQMVGATDGLGAGQGGLAVHASLRRHNVGGREVRHTSKMR